MRWISTKRNPMGNGGMKLIVCRICLESKAPQTIVRGTGACRRCVRVAGIRAGAHATATCCGCGCKIGAEEALQTGRCKPCRQRVGLE